MKHIFKLMAMLFALSMVAAACSSDSGETGSDTTSGDDPTTDDTSDDSSSGEYDGKIAVLLPDSASSARWENDDRRLLKAAFEEAGLTEGEDFTISNAEGDASTMQSQAESAITDGATVLMMVNLDSGSGAAIIDMAREAGAKVIDYDRLTAEGPGADYYVSFDNVAVGINMGRAMEDALADFDGVPNVMILDGGPTDNNATLFAEGYMSVAQPKFDDGTWNLVSKQAVPDWDNAQAQTIAEQILTEANNEVDAAIVANDGMAGGVIAALKAQGLQVPVTGQDATEGGIQNILLGDQYMTVYKPINLEANAAAELALALISTGAEDLVDSGDVTNNGTNDIPSILVDSVRVTADNVEETVIADGFRTKEEICTGDVVELDFCK